MPLPKSKQKASQSGFTLIELLVVISVISLLSSIVMTSVATARRNGRDVKRKTDVKVLAQAIELYKGDKGSYPTGVDDTLGALIDHGSNGSFIPELVSGGYINQPILPIGNDSTWGYWYITRHADNTSCAGGGLVYINGNVLGAACGYSDTTSFCHTNAKAAIIFFLEQGVSKDYTQVPAYGGNAYCFY